MQLSENAARVVGRELPALLEASIQSVVPKNVLQSILAELSAGVRSTARKVTLGNDPGRAFDAVAHRQGESLIVELEPLDPRAVSEIDDIFDAVRSYAGSLQDARTVADVAKLVIGQIAGLTDFDRVMVYRFDRDWCGEVIAERVADGLPPFLGLHYPESDIPSQARDLYRRNALRFIPDVEYQPARIVPELDPLNGRPLDLSDSVLRSVSPVHLEYLRNMGVAATLTISLLKDGRLWGLIACHNRMPRYVSYRVRGACELLGRTAAMRITELEETAAAEIRVRLRSLLPALTAAISREGNFVAAIGGSPELLEVTNARGAAIKTDGLPTLIGRTPPLAKVRAMIRWLDERCDRENPFSTDALPLVNPDFADCLDAACGLLAVPLTTDRGGWLLWFRPEVVRTVSWGGNPEKPAELLGSRISPRRSFESWMQTVALHSLPWESSEVEVAMDVRRLLSDVMMKRAHEYARLNIELSRSNAELASFAQLASHDLREPLRGLSNYAKFLHADYAHRLDEAGVSMLASMISLSKRMDEQITSLLELAQVGQDSPYRRRANADDALDAAIALLGPRIDETATQIVRTARLPAVFMNPVRLREVFVNLIGNAMKYSLDTPLCVEIGTSQIARPSQRSSNRSTDTDTPMATIYVRDNGIGIESRHLETIFRMFRRLHTGSAFGGGSGAGLAIVRKIIERNGGVIWAESSPGQGSTFYFTAPLIRTA